MAFQLSPGVMISEVDLTTIVPSVSTTAGAYAGYWVAKNLVKSQQMWMTIAISVVGAIVGAGVQAKMGAKKGVPTATTIGTPAK